MIVITERKVSEKVQPNIRRGNLYIVVSTGTLKSGSVSLLCHVRSNDKQLHRINAERFIWRKITQAEIDAAEKRAAAVFSEKMRQAAEEKFKHECEKSYNDLKQNFSWDDHIQIAFVPLVIAHIAWVYAEKTRKWCADHRISDVIKLSRAVRKVREDYIDFLRKDLDMKHIESIERQAEQFLKEPKTALDFQIAYYSISNEYYRQYPDVELQECRVYATISRLMIEAYKRHNAKMNALIASKLGHSESVDNTLITDKLDTCMDAYLGDYVLTKTEEIGRIERIFDISLSRFEFQVNGKESW